MTALTKRHSTLTVLLSGLLLCGCSQKQVTSARQAIDLVEAGKDISWSDGNATHIMHIAKRDGASLEGIRVVDKSDGGLVTTITADKGTLQSHFQTTVSSGVEYTNAVMITLYDAQVQSATTNQTVKEYGVVFHQ